ncbi:hypothetical protein [Streptomyces sp. NPDC051561]|uniref:hypothetical protein n=1 Tax=Streptomyces sp. NPDC051561 TaxID=3365658 RepID=UPI0037B55C26
MPEPLAEPQDSETFPALCGYTHLFPGVRCRLQGLPDPQAFAAAPRPVGVDLNFSDGTSADADLRTDGDAGPVLVVPAHTTGAGTHVGECTWPVKKLTPLGDDVELTLGSRDREARG